MVRQCSRTGCSQTAVATLSYHYQQSQVWIDELTSEREPHYYDLCRRHSEKVSVPNGWHLHDRRMKIVVTAAPDAVFAFGQRLAG